jgi:hypothetical protein
VYVGVEVGAGGVYMAVCVPKKDATIEPTAEVIKASGLSVAVSSPVHAANMRVINIAMSVLLMYFFIRVSDINLSQNYKNQVGEIPTFGIPPSDKVCWETYTSEIK